MWMNTCTGTCQYWMLYTDTKNEHYWILYRAPAKFWAQYIYTGKVSFLVESIRITIFIMRSHMYHDNYMSIKNRKYYFNLMDLNKTVQYHSIQYVSWLNWSKMNITMTFIEVPVGKFNGLLHVSLGCPPFWYFYF